MTDDKMPICSYTVDSVVTFLHTFVIDAACS